MTYESVKQVLLTYRGDNTTTSPVAVAGAGGLCGVVSWALIYPIDSAKSIYQRNCLMHQKGEVMTKAPKTVSRDATTVEALRLMWDCGFRHLPVTERGRAIGLVRRRDFKSEDLSRLEEERNFWEHMR